MKKLGLVSLLVLLMATISFAQTDIGLKAVGGKIGFVMPEDPIDNTLGFGAVADLGTITETINLAAFVEYWRKSYGDVYGDVAFSEIAIGATAKYYFPMESDFLPYAGAGLALNIASWSYDYPAPYSNLGNSQSNTDIGFHICGGADYPLSDTMTGFAELKYSIDGIDTFSIFAGVKFLMGN